MTKDQEERIKLQAERIVSQAMEEALEQLETERLRAMDSICGEAFPIPNAPNPKKQSPLPDQLETPASVTTEDRSGGSSIPWRSGPGLVVPLKRPRNDSRPVPSEPTTPSAQPKRNS
jgi:hypothetical protein